MTISATGAADALMAMFAAPSMEVPPAAADPLAAFRAAFELALATPVEAEVEVAAVSEDAQPTEDEGEEEPVEARVAIAAFATPPSAARPLVWAPPVRMEARETESAVSAPPPESGGAPRKTAMEAPVEIGALEPAAAPQVLHSPEAFSLRLQDAAAADGPQNESQETQSVEGVEAVAAGAPRLAQNRNDEPAAQQRDRPDPRKEAPEVRSGDAPARAASAAIPAPLSGMPAAAAHPDAPQAARIEPPTGTAAAQALEPVEAPREPVSASGPPRLALRVGGPDRAPEASLELDLTSPAARPAVDVIVEQRRGDVHFSVRSADPLLVQDLRGSVGELTGRLEQSGYRAETWTPAETFRTAEPLASRSGDSRFQEDSGERGGGWTGQDSRNPSRDGQRQPDGERPRWLIELEESFFGSGAKRA